MYIYIYIYIYIYAHTSICQRTRYRRTNPHPVAWGGVGGIITSLAFPHEPDATLYDLQLQFHMNLMLRSMIFSCNSTHPHPIVWGGVGWGGIITSLAFPQDLDATLYDLHWHFHMNLMLRSMIFNVRKSCGCPFWGWSDGRVVIPKVDGLFFDRFWMQKLAPRCEDVVILIIIARRYRFRRDKLCMCIYIYW